MAVKDFLPLGEVKQTIEKEVPRKLSLAELTSVEVPGKPSPALQLEEDKEKKKPSRRKRIEKSENVKVSKPVKDSILIVTEKPQAAMKIANSLGNARKIGDFGVSYYEVERNGKKILVASAVGHLFNLTYKQGQKGWPIFELEWRPSFERKNAGFTKKYLDLLKKLARRAEEIIIATDYDIEGEVIGWNVLRFVCKRESAKRMKFSTLTADELRNSFEKPMKELDWGNAYAGETRHILDWLYGINLSRALMSSLKKGGVFKVLSIGRVQGPALKIIVDKEKEIMNFKPVPFWQVFAVIKGYESVEFKHPKDIFDKKELEKFNDIKELNAETKKSRESVPPGHPFDLTSLQREAYRLYRISPSDVLKIAQKLYLDGLISYPRTSSQKIPESIEPKKILKKLAAHFPEAKMAVRDKPVEGKKSDPAHPSIYPTGEYVQLSEKDEKLYNLIVKRFIAAFAQDAITANKKVVLTDINNEGIKFSASGLKVEDKGWTSFYPATLEERDIPDLDGKVEVEKIRIEEKETQPPNRYTPASLITLLEKKNLGTKSTRSMIIDTLFERGYLDGKSIQATPLGIRLIDSLEKYSPIIVDENLTRQLEEEMEKMQSSKDKFKEKEKEVIDKVKRLISDIAREFKAHEDKIGEALSKGIVNMRQEQQVNNTLMKCPGCRQGDLRVLYSKKTKRYFVGCTKYPDCTQTYSLPPNSLIKKAETQCQADMFPKLLAIRKGKRPWEFCFNPECPVEKQKREEWQASKNVNGD